MCAPHTPPPPPSLFVLNKQLPLFTFLKQVRKLVYREEGGSARFALEVPYFTTLLTGTTWFHGLLSRYTSGCKDSWVSLYSLPTCVSKGGDRIACLKTGILHTPPHVIKCGFAINCIGKPFLSHAPANSWPSLLVNTRYPSIAKCYRPNTHHEHFNFLDYSLGAMECST